MALDIQSSLDDIPIEPPIGLHDLYHIAKCMNVAHRGGNVLLFPINSQWTQYFNENNINYYSLERTEGRRILFRFNRSGLLTGFCTDTSWHRSSVLLRSEVTRIQNCVARLHAINNSNDPTCEFLKDPITFELLNNPYTASDGNTYSANTLHALFNPSPYPEGYVPISPFTRQPLVRLPREWSIDDQYGMYGIKNILIQKLISKLFEERLTIMDGGKNHNKKRKSIKKKFKI
jgi:hypothetical protein